jgi:Lon protease-like protein
MAKAEMATARMDHAEASPPVAATLLLPVLPLDDVCLLPGASLSILVNLPAAVTAVQIATRTGDRLLAVARREPGGRELHGVGTIAEVRGLHALSPREQRVELDGVTRARVSLILGVDALVAEAVPLLEGDAGEEWGAAVEALARYLHAHADLRTYLEGQRRSGDAMSWVNLACQHLPITASARQKLLEANAADRCLKISRGLDALLKKEQT